MQRNGVAAKSRRGSKQRAAAGRARSASARPSRVDRPQRVVAATTSCARRRARAAPVPVTAVTGGSAGDVLHQRGGRPDSSAGPTASRRRQPGTASTSVGSGGAGGRVVAGPHQPELHRLRSPSGSVYATSGSRSCGRPRTPVSSSTSRTAADERMLAAVELALGQAPVVVPRPVHHADLDAVRRPARQSTPPAARTGVAATQPALPMTRRSNASCRWMCGSVGSAGRRCQVPSPARSQPSLLVAHRQLQHVAQIVLGGRQGDPHQRLDPAVQVAVHQVGRADPVLGVVAGAEPEDPGVLQEPADDRADPDVVRQPGHARAQRAHARG